MRLSGMLLRSFFVLFFGMAMMIQGCAKKPYIDLNYQLPAPSASQKGKKVCLTITDKRQDPDLFGETAGKEFQNFTGFFNLTVVDTDQKSSQVGAFELEQLFQRAMEKRLQNMGIEVLSKCSDQQLAMQVTIKTFKINLANQRWKAQVSYEASLTADGKNFVKETVTGKGERVKLMGTKAAQTVVGELFSDMINRLDINRLFDQSMP